MKICVAGQGAFGQKHLDALKRIPEAEVVSLVGGNQDATAEVAKKYGVPHWGSDLSEGIRRADAVILATPTQMHRGQGEQVMRAGKHVLIEIPIADSVPDSEALVKIQQATGVVAMGGMSAVSIQVTNGCTSGSGAVNSRSSRWTCRPISSAVPT